MIKSDKKLKEFGLILKSNSSIKVTAAIKSLREEEPYEGAISLLVSYYDNSNNSDVRKVIEGFFNDIKDQSSRKEIVAEIKKELKEETLRMLITSCWQSGLDYAEHISEFLEIFLLSDYLTALECFTVIETSAPRITKGKKDELIRRIKEYSSSLTENKDTLSLELISLLS